MATESHEIAEEFRALQSRICESIEKTDGGATFSREEWNREEGGGGLTRVLQGGAIIEKGGVNFSAVNGSLSAAASRALEINASSFFATGVSIVMHPLNPFVPIIHMNVRYFETDQMWWFGGGIDLSPHYVSTAQADAFHSALKSVCDRHDSQYYQQFERWARDYFFIKHRGESRGVGGIFFDRLNQESEGKTKAELWDFVMDVGQQFAPIYTALMKEGAQKPYTAQNQQWQFHRRSRYAEFNLLYDRGTRFGLETNGRVDSILMSLPPRTGWLSHQTWPANGEEMHTERLLKTTYAPKGR